MLVFVTDITVGLLKKKEYTLVKTKLGKGVWKMSMQGSSECQALLAPQQKFPPTHGNTVYSPSPGHTHDQAQDALTYK